MMSLLLIGGMGTPGEEVEDLGLCVVPLAEEAWGYAMRLRVNPSCAWFTCWIPALPHSLPTTLVDLVCPTQVFQRSNQQYTMCMSRALL